MPKDFYEVLGVSRTASDKEVRQAYRRLARKHHPDVNPGNKLAEEKFKEITQAYETLSDKEKRAQYDRFGHLGDAWKQAAGQPGAGGGMWSTGGPQVEFDVGGVGGLGDLFERFFGEARKGTRGRTRHAPERGQDIHTAVELTLEEAYSGTSRRVTVSDPGGGSRTIEVRIPAGVENGARIRAAGQGGQAGGGVPGDLYLIVTIRAHAVFERRGANLYCDLPVTYPEAALGAEVECATMRGKVKVKVPAGSSSGQTLRLTGLGMPQVKGAGNGDLYARLKIVMPKHLTEEERRLVERLRQLRPESPRRW